MIQKFWLTLSCLIAFTLTFGVRALAPAAQAFAAAPSLVVSQQRNAGDFKLFLVALTCHYAGQSCTNALYRTTGPLFALSVGWPISLCQVVMARNETNKWHRKISKHSSFFGHFAGFAVACILPKPVDVVVNAAWLATLFKLSSPNNKPAPRAWSKKDDGSGSETSYKKQNVFDQDEFDDDALNTISKVKNFSQNNLGNSLNKFNPNCSKIYPNLEKE